MNKVDLNCDLGEGMIHDEQLLPYITSANIACGVHAGDDETMKRTVEFCLKHYVLIGAHPSLPDKVNFGRKELQINTAEVKLLVQEQIFNLKNITQSFGTELHHIKPHGALYNMAAKNKEIARSIAEAVRQIDEDLELYGLSGSYSISETKALGLKTKSEVFADRTYQDDGSLVDRSQPGALIDDESYALKQVLQMVERGTVRTLSGKTIPIIAETICIHSDGKNALRIAKSLHLALFNRHLKGN